MTLPFLFPLPLLIRVKNSGRSSPDSTTGHPSDSLAPPFATNLYRSLGSVSDLAASDDGKDVDDEDFPGKEEIMATSSRIFGTDKFPKPPALESRTTTIRPSDFSNSLPPAEVSPTSKTDSLLKSLPPEVEIGHEGEGDDSYDMAPFDLSRVFSALQEMKAEISNMEDEAERRKAAARVALGLVYGLEADAE